MGHYAKRFFGQNKGIITDGLKLWLDAGNPASYSGSGTAWNDLSGNGNNGTLVNGVAYNTVNGGVMSFDGLNDYVNVGNINAVTNELTVACWFKSFTTNTPQGIISKWKTGAETDNSYLLLNDDNSWDKFTFGIYQSDNISKIVKAQDFTIIPNTWYHIQATAGSGVLSIYVNGVKSTDTVAYNGTIKQTTRPLLIGKLRIEDSIFLFSGLINEPTIYNRALSAAEVLANFNATKSRYGL